MTPYSTRAHSALQDFINKFGFKAAHNETFVYDFKATILHLMGLDHERLSYYHNGVERRLTNVHGHVVKDVLA